MYLWLAAGPPVWQRLWRPDSADLESRWLIASRHLSKSHVVKALCLTAYPH